MSLPHLSNLAKAQQLKEEPYDEKEYQGLLSSGRTRLKDALNESLAKESRFDLAYNAAHSFALAALRKHGYRSVNRYLVFQVLPHTLGTDETTWRILDLCHKRRNSVEYEGIPDIDEQLLKDLLGSTQSLLAQIDEQTKKPE